MCIHIYIYICPRASSGGPWSRRLDSMEVTATIPIRYFGYSSKGGAVGGGCSGWGSMI